MQNITAQNTKNFAPEPTTDPLPMVNSCTTLLNVERLPQHQEKHYEIKDPSVVQLSDGRYMMYASVGNSVTQTWLVGRFEAIHPNGPWKELEPVVFQNISGPQLCAPAVTYEEKNGKPVFKMYIQTACFEENGVIALATSEDGHVFWGQPNPLATRHSIKDGPAPVVGVYDVGVSEVKQGNEELICMLYSGYRKVGCGDLYLSYRKKSDPDTAWSAAECLMAQEDLPFHNRPDYEYYEWGLEGAKLIQLDEECFLLIGVCFMPRPNEFLGTRQRVFFATSKSMNGPFVPVGTPFTPQEVNGKAGENGHPDTMVINDTLWVIYQERNGEGMPWHLRCAQYDMEELQYYLEQVLHRGGVGQQRNPLERGSAETTFQQYNFLQVN